MQCTEFRGSPLETEVPGGIPIDCPLRQVYLFNKTQNSLTMHSRRSLNRWVLTAAVNFSNLFSRRPDLKTSTLEKVSLILEIGGPLVRIS